jgi:hypothetical protein
MAGYHSCATDESIGPNRPDRQYRGLAAAAQYIGVDVFIHDGLADDDDSLSDEILDQIQDAVQRDVVATAEYAERLGVRSEDLLEVGNDLGGTEDDIAGTEEYLSAIALDNFALFGKNARGLILVFLTLYVYIWFEMLQDGTCPRLVV